jgi:carboxypeptidase family protein/TonB-dependent receptor-like protein
MKQSRVSAFARAARFFALAAVALGWGAGALLAQETGKIEGRVRDQAGAPIANSQVYVVGTAFSALTNPQGYYFMNNVPAGTVAVRAAFIGYKSTQVEGVRILTGQTITVDIQLEQTAVQIQEITVVTQTQPLVPRDEVTTKQRVNGEMADQLPVDRLNGVLALLPGVSASASGNSLYIRGSRPEESATYIDGVPVQAGFRGGYSVSGATRVQQPTSEVAVGTTGFEEASITTGSSSAEYGNAQSGVVSIATKTGGNQLTSSLSYETDEPFGVNHSLGYNKIEGGLSGPLGAKGLTFSVATTFEGRASRNVDATSIDGPADGQADNITGADGFGSADAPVFVPAGVDTTVAVPVSPGSATSDTTYVDVLKWAAYRGQCEQFATAGDSGLKLNRGTAAINGIRDNYGVGCRGIRLPDNSQGFYSANAKLNYTYGTGSRISLSGIRSQTQRRNFDYLAIANPVDLTGTQLRNSYLTLNWTQNLTKSSERALALDTYLSYQQDRTLNGVLTRQSELDSRDPFGGFLFKGLDFAFDFNNFPINDELINNIRTNTGRRGMVPFNDNNYLTASQYRTNAYASNNPDQTVIGGQFEESGGPQVYQRMYNEKRLIVKSNLDWQFDRYNRLKLGGEYTHYDIANFMQFWTSQSFADAWKGKPIRWNAFIEDRLDVGDVVVVGGLRYDRFSSHAMRPFYTDTFTLGGKRVPTGLTVDFPRISSAPGFDPTNTETFGVLHEDPSHHYLSPHIQVSFPVTDKTNFRFSYAHQVESPDFGLVYGGINTDRSTTNTNQAWGTDLDFGKTVTFEFGIRHAFSDDMVLDLAMYNKDNLANPSARLVTLFDPNLQGDQLFQLIENVDFGNTRGIDVRLDRRFGNLFNGTISYSYQQAKNTGSDPYSTTAFRSRLLAGLGGTNLGPPQAALPTDYSRPHTVAGAASLAFPNDWHRGTTLGSVLKDVGVYTTFRYTSGTAYTSCLPGDAGSSSPSAPIVSGEVCAGQRIAGTFNGSRLPSFKQLDMRFTKGFSLGRLDLTAYLDVRNILNFRNVLQVFTVTNNISSAEDSTRWFTRESGDLQAEAAKNNVLGTDGTIDLTAPGVCKNWTSTSDKAVQPSCVYLIRAEQRWGNGDGLYTADEQESAIAAFYHFARGENRFTGTPRRARIGFELNF